MKSPLEALTRAYVDQGPPAKSAAHRKNALLLCLPE
jgi:hypothetical protein